MCDGSGGGGVLVARKHLGVIMWDYCLFERYTFRRVCPSRPRLHSVTFLSAMLVLRLDCNKTGVAASQYGMDNLFSGFSIVDWVGSGWGCIFAFHSTSVIRRFESISASWSTTFHKSDDVNHVCWCASGSSVATAFMTKFP